MYNSPGMSDNATECWNGFLKLRSFSHNSPEDLVGMEDESAKLIFKWLLSFANKHFVTRTKPCEQCHAVKTARSGRGNPSPSAAGSACAEHINNKGTPHLCSFGVSPLAFVWNMCFTRRRPVWQQARQRAVELFIFRWGKMRLYQRRRRALMRERPRCLVLVTQAMDILFTLMVPTWFSVLWSTS